MGDKYFITGRGGFIGGHVVAHVGSESVINDIETDCVVIHLAAYGNHYYQNEADKIIKANISDLQRLVERAKNIGVKKVYNISTSSVTLPVQTMYSASKLFGETFINSLNDERFVSVRPYSVYGEGEAAHRFIPTVIRCLRSGEKMKLAKAPQHDWVHVKDFISAMFAGYTEIGTGLSYSNMQIVEMLELISGNKLNYEEIPGRGYDSLRWVCKKSVPHRYIYEGLKQTYEHYTKP